MRSDKCNLINLATAVDFNVYLEKARNTRPRQIFSSLCLSHWKQTRCVGICCDNNYSFVKGAISDFFKMADSADEEPTVSEPRSGMSENEIIRMRMANFLNTHIQSIFC